jgi:hypothetical protein
VGRCGRAVTGLVFFLVGHSPLVAGPCHSSKKWATFHADVGPSPVAPFRTATGDRTLSSLAPACVGRSADPVWYYGRHDGAPSFFTAPLSVLHLLAAGHVPDGVRCQAASRPRDRLTLPRGATRHSATLRSQHNGLGTVGACRLVKYTYCSAFYWTPSECRRREPNVSDRLR